MDIIERIEKLKESLGYTTNSLAVKAGLTQSTLQTILSKRNLPSIPTLEKICTAFGISLSEFFAESSMSENPLHVFELLNTEPTPEQIQREFKNVIKDLTPEQTKHITQLIKSLKD